MGELSRFAEPEIRKKMFSKMFLDHDNPRRTVFFKTVGGCVCAGGAIAELFLLAVSPAGFWHNGGLSFLEKASLMAAICLWWAFLVQCCHLYLVVAQRIYSRVAGRFKRWSVVVVSVAAPAVALHAYVVSWLFFGRLHAFPDVDAVMFAAMNSEMLVKYFWQAERGQVGLQLLLFLLGIGVCALTARAALRVPVRAARQPLRTVVSLCILALLSLNFGYFALLHAKASAIRESDVRDRTSAAKVQWASYAHELQYHVNPVVTMLGSVVSMRGTEHVLKIPMELLEPRVAEQYRLSSVDRDSPPPNIILITIESLRSDAVLSSRDGHLIVPQISELARSGCFFPNCYANSSHSDYSDPSILHSLYPARSNHPYYYRRGATWPKMTLADVCKLSGYGTALFSSQNEAWSNMHLLYEDAAFDIFFDSRTSSEQTIAERGYFSHWMAETGQIAGKLDDAVTMDHAIEWIRDRGNQPFCIAMNLQSSHFPYERPDAKDGPFQPARIDSSTTFTAYSDTDTRLVRNAYFNALRYVDSQIEKLVKFLDSQSLRKNTIIAITGDHGEAFNEEGLCGHARLPTEAVIRVGLVINFSGKVPVGIDPYLAQSIDIVPTVLRLAGFENPPVFQGIDVLAADRPPGEQRLAFVHCCNPAVNADAVISGTGWKLINDRRRGTYVLQLNPSVAGPNSDRQDRDVSRLLQRTLDEWHANQITYYEQSRYHLLFYAPREPQLSTAELRILIGAAMIAKE